MKKKYIFTTAFLISIIFGGQAFAQITITIPKLPKIKKPKVETTTTTNGGGDSQSGNSGATTENKPDEQPYEQTDGRISLFLDKLAKAQKDVDQYNPNDSLYLVGSDSSEWLWRAVSTTERTAFLEQWKSVMTPGAKKRFDDGFVALAASAAKKLPTIKRISPDFRLAMRRKKN